ncbi:hypothetical protein PUR61_00305 [Streptomyces sp. BE20]|uniref:hypothetical protein n=1 Tax=Streptomyces sp. BE20 TaxID=3002525 RepID=UPI002E7671C3|nr:hypothetical protein [Streptomyces sp. BE20]MEE1820658.1 hypothetical protein [Streptomyces sp. BE20]
MTTEAYVYDAIRTRGDIILFIDELHTLVGAGAAEGAIDAASILKPMLAINAWLGYEQCASERKVTKKLG